MTPSGQPELGGGGQAGNQESRHCLLRAQPQRWEGDQTVTRIKGYANRGWAAWILGGDPGRPLNWVRLACLSRGFS